MERSRMILGVLVAAILLVALVDGLGIVDIADFGMASHPKAAEH